MRHLRWLMVPAIFVVDDWLEQRTFVPFRGGTELETGPGTQNWYWCCDQNASVNWTRLAVMWAAVAIVIVVLIAVTRGGFVMSTSLLLYWTLVVDFYRERYNLPEDVYNWAMGSWLVCVVLIMVLHVSARMNGWLGQAPKQSFGEWLGAVRDALVNFNDISINGGASPQRPKRGTPF